MKKILLGLFIVSTAMVSCKNNRNSASNSISTETASVQPIVKDNEKEKECLNEKHTVTASPEQDGRTEALINMGGYNYSHTQPQTNFQGASGYGTGGSYAATSYGSQSRKDAEKVCTNEGIQVVRPEMEHSNENFYTSPENEEQRDDILQEETNMEWNNTRSADPDPGDQSEIYKDSNNDSLEEENRTDNSWPTDENSGSNNSWPTEPNHSEPEAEPEQTDINNFGGTQNMSQPQSEADNGNTKNTSEQEYDEVPW